MIVGIGIDSVEIARVAEKCSAGDSRFEEKMFTELERARSRRNRFEPYQHLAACFAAREAFFKATQIWYLRSNVSIAQRPGGEPYFVLSERISIRMAQRMEELKAELSMPQAGHLGVAVSLTHDREYATAFAVCELL
jgi:holo-[acyl-carrier protein] synthase